MYDVIVIGAGPAGSTAATLLAQEGKNVLLLEKSRFPRGKLCGEFITPECLDIFQTLGVRERMFDAGAQSINRWTFFAPDGRGIDVPIEWIADGYPHAIGITRSRMDSILLDRAREVGVEIREGFHVSRNFSLNNGIGTIQGKADGAGIERFSAKIVIDASGRNGAFSNHIIRKKISRLEGSRLFGCKVHLRNIEGLRGIGELFFFRNGYGGISDVEGARTNLCFLTTEATLLEARGDREKLLDLTVRSNPAGRQRLKNVIIDGEWLGTGPISYGRSPMMTGVLAIGDAGAFIDPFTGSGILLALTSGAIAATVISEASKYGHYDFREIAGRYRELHRSHFGLRFKACSMLRRIAFNPLARNITVSALTRYPALMRLAALSTRKLL